MFPLRGQPPLTSPAAPGGFSSPSPVVMGLAHGLAKTVFYPYLLVKEHLPQGLLSL